MRFHDFIRDTDGWRLIGDETHFANPHLEVHTVTVTSPTRPTPFKWTVTHRKAAVVIAPITSEGKFLLVRQERVPIRATIWEFPAGQIDDASTADAVRATGLRELTEESGYELAADGELISLGHYFPSCGFTDEHSHLLLARGVIPSKGGAQPDSAEAITACHAFTPDELRAMIATGEVRDANTLAAFARIVAMGLMPSGR
jgi:ADP-ribose pyrophosphatase